MLSCQLVIYLLFASGLEVNPWPALVAIQPPLANFDLRWLHIIATPDDSLCFLHALRSLIQPYQHINISEELIITSLRSEVDLNYDKYMPFTSSSQGMFLAQLNRYYNRSYNSNAVDLLSVMAANAI